MQIEFGLMYSKMDVTATKGDVIEEHLSYLKW